MLGYLKPEKMELVMKDYQYYKLYYCSICRHLVRNNPRIYSFLTGYEGTLMAMMYNELVVRDIEAVKDRCSGAPLVKVAALPADHEAVQLGAYLCLLAFQVKSQDDLLDESGFWITRYNRFFQNHIRKSFTGRIQAYEKFNIDLPFVLSQQRELNRLEKDEAIKNIDIFLGRWAEIFSYIMSQPFKGKIADGPHGLLKRFFQRLGKVINLLDAMADIHIDYKNSQFNLILRAEPLVETESRNWLGKTHEKYSQRLEAERKELLTLLPGLNLRESYSIVQNILTHSLDNELKKVFDFMVLKKKHRDRVLLNCKDF
ncbi:MAG: DUF5685 family protein [Nitrospinales bacterium]